VAPGGVAALCEPPPPGNGVQLVVSARHLELGHDEFPAGVGFGGHSLEEAEIASQQQPVLPCLYTDPHALLSADQCCGDCRHGSKTRVHGATAANRIPNRFKDKGKRAAIGQ